MTRAEIFEKMKEIIADIMDMDASGITESDSLKALGANSIDRADIIVTTIEEVDVKIPMMSFSNAKNIGEIIDIICANL